MNMTDEVGWTELARTWVGGDREAANPEAVIRRSVHRQTVLLRWVLAGEVMVTLVSLAVVWWVLATEREAVRVGWVIGAGLHSVVIWTFTLWNRRGIWGPLGHSTAEYLRLAKERLRRQRRSADFVLGLIGVEIAALLVWVASGPNGETDSSPRLVVAWAPAGVISAAAIWWAVRHRATATAELERLIAMERQLLTEPG